MAEFKFTDDQWREYQAIPEQGYSHRHWLEYQVNTWLLDHDQEVTKAALITAAEDAEKVARLDATPFNQATNAEHSYMRYHDLNKVREEDVRTVANWLHGRAALVGAPRITASVDAGPDGV